jgi:hypothetical protein
VLEGEIAVGFEILDIGESGGGLCKQLFQQPLSFEAGDIAQVVAVEGRARKSGTPVLPYTTASPSVISWRALRCVVASAIGPN